MTHGRAGGKTWAGEQDGLLGTSRAITELGITADPRRPCPSTGWGLLSAPGALCYHPAWRQATGAKHSHGMGRWWLQGDPGEPGLEGGW